jgi:hypothetical protein
MLGSSEGDDDKKETDMKSGEEELEEAEEKKDYVTVEQDQN